MGEDGKGLSRPEEDWWPGPEVTLEEFRKWRHPRRGVSNPERADNPVWEWLVEQRIYPYSASTYFNEPDAYKAGPGWCFCRFGQTRTELPDGRLVFVAGEHEDFYDPDFYIYNDVVILHPDDRLEILIYPETDFPPTDFHTATLLGDRILLIGNMGYRHVAGHTQVLSLNLQTYEIRSVETDGDSPGWIHRHTAELDAATDRIVVRDGKVAMEEDIVENFDQWALDLKTWRWSRLTRLVRKVWWISPAGGGWHSLFELRRRAYDLLNPPRTKRRLNPGREIEGNPDPELLKRLYRPSVAHQFLGDSEDEIRGSDDVLVEIDGIRIRFREDSSSVSMTVEGDLPDELCASLAEECRLKLEEVTAVEWVAKREVRQEKPISPES